MLSKEEKNVLSQKGIYTGYKTVGEYRIQIEQTDGSQIIKFRVEEASSGIFEFSQSHFIKTPEQATQYITSRNSERTAEDALMRAVDSIMSHYSQAVKVGHVPSKAWFKPNKNF